MVSDLIFSLRETSVSFGKKIIFDNLDVNIHRKDLIALIGKNGVGKSTLMRIISDKQDLDQGEVWKLNNIRVSFFSQKFELEESYSIENELLNILDIEEDSFKIDIFCNNLQLNKKDIIKNLSGGQKRRVGLIKSLINESDILLLDEPTNHLDLECIIWLENYLKTFKGSIICVSHDRAFLSNFTNKVFWLDRGNLRVSPSGFKNFDRWSQEMFEQEARELKNRKQFVNIEVEWANKGVKARVKRNIKRLERAKELKDQLEKDESSYRKAIQTVKINKIIPGLDNSKFIAEFHKVSVGYEIPKKTILKDINLKINKKDRIGLIGKNGTGKSTFLKALLGEIKSQKGTIKLKKNMNFSYFDQLRNDLNTDNSLKKILVPSGGDYLKVQGKDRHVCSYLKDFMFDPSKATDSINTLSGGQQNRLLLAKVLANPQTGLILDEPTNDLDLETMDLLTEMLSNYSGTLLIVSHDRDFLDQTVNKILYFDEKGQASIFLGGYSDFLKSQQNEKIIKSISKKKNNYKVVSSKNNKKLSFKYKYELENLPKEIEDLENKIDDITKELKNSNLYLSDANRFNEITNEMLELKKILSIKEERWLFLSEMEEKNE
ncbi:ABC-F family ATP-binding cassette domain-containing protein [Alphaproteobacteria bacterium]|nr:ABC-F family ATP-binding cassette domain-containing protein [Alphaproteobacteria bacterium]